MSLVHYLDPIDYLSGKITKRHRTIYCYRNEVDRRYTTVHTKSSKDPSAAQTSVRQKFADAVAGMLAIMADPAQLEPYRTQWKNHVKSGKTDHRTLRGFIFAEVYKTL